MPVREMSTAIRRRVANRVLVFGPPNSLKTTAIIKTAHYPLHIISFPGEMGWTTIPEGVKGLKAWVWEEAPSDPVSADSMRKEVEDTVYRSISGQNGPCRTLALEGFHKLYDVYLNVATAGSFGRGEDFEAQRYGRAHQMAASFLRKVLSSPVEYLIVTAWNAREADKPGEKEAHEWPDLPGKMAKLITGMFSLVIFSRTKTVMGKPGLLQGEWLLKPDMEVWGASMKVDPRMALKLPPKVEQDYKKLYSLIGAVEQEVGAEGGDVAAEPQDKVA
jgi:hypothetical protein